MRIVFVSNYYTHHQAPFSEAMIKNGVDYYFIETEQMEQERLNMGWAIDTPSFVVQLKDNLSICIDLINSADAVIFGNSPYWLVKKRLETKKITFIYSERIYKKFPSKIKYPGRFLKMNIKFSKRNLFLLCSSAFVSYDFAKTLTFLGKAYKWGYFPKTYYYDVDDLIKKKSSTLTVLWVGRFIDWKHPELIVRLAEVLKIRGYEVKIKMIGDGPLFCDINSDIQANGLFDMVELLGTMKPELVRKEMENANILISTSDRNEGWGAVINEAMNSACAVVASSLVGSAPYLITDGENGEIYEDGSFDSLVRKVVYLLDNDDLVKKLGKNAYYAICNMWNAEIAAQNLICLVENKIGIKNNQIEEGPCSKAKIMRDKWYYDC